MCALYIWIFFLSDILIYFPLSYISRYTSLRSRAIRRLVCNRVVFRPSWHMRSLANLNNRDMQVKNMGLLFDTFQSHNIQGYVIRCTVAHQQFKNQCAHARKATIKSQNRSANLGGDGCTPSLSSFLLQWVPLKQFYLIGFAGRSGL